MAKHKATERNVVTVLARVMSQCVERGEDGKDNRRWWAQRLNEICDNPNVVEDFFGTEGQNDPRGDQRD